MENLKECCIQYIEATLGQRINTGPWHGEKELPLFLREQYQVHQTSLLDRPLLLIVDRNREERSPGNVRKQIETVRSKWVGDVVYIRASITAYNRSRLIAQKIPFIVPGSQMYLPAFGISLREYFRANTDEAKYLSPSAQALLLMLIHVKADVPVTPKAMAERLGYTAMSMTRAFSELKGFDIGEHAQRGKYREVRLVDPRKQIWEKAQPYLRSPMKQKGYVSIGGSIKELPLSGLSALAEYSSISPPESTVYACSGETWRSGRLALDMVPVPGPETCEIEVWSYPPALFAQNGVVDQLSLFLSLRGTEDERVEQALGQMMEKIAW